jgi:hypothetical protein
MTATWYAIVDHLGPIDDLIGREVTIAAVRMMSVTMSRGTYEIRRTMTTMANGRAWCRVVPNGSQVPTRGGIMRVHAEPPLEEPLGVMLSADEMLVRVKAERDALAESLREMTSERDRLRDEVQRLRERAAERDAFNMYEVEP